MRRRSVGLAAAGLGAAALVAGLAVVLTGGDDSPPPVTRRTLTATADTRVEQDEPDANYGTSTRLGIDADDASRTFLKFRVTRSLEPIRSVSLRLHVADLESAGSDDGGTWVLMDETGWAETEVTWDDQPTLDGVTVADVGPVARDSWVEIDLTGRITAGGVYSLVGTSGSDDGADFDSRETSQPPQLVINAGSVPSPASSSASSPSATGSSSPATGTPSPSTAPSGGAPVLVGAGDIATSESGDSATAALVADLPDATVFTVGDNAYPDGTRSDYASYYESSWGAFKERTRPAPGNHEYRTDGAAGYFEYFGTLAGPAGRGYYSYDLGDWHVVSLDSEIPMEAGSPQETWLRADLAASGKRCTLAYWHRPLFTSGAEHGPATETRPLFQALYDAGAEVVLTGHNHQYERFAPLAPDGALDPARGIREFVVGTGGGSHYGFGTVQPHSEARNDDTHGVLALTLRSTGFDWRFIPVAGKSYTDTGSGTCH